MVRTLSSCSLAKLLFQVDTRASGYGGGGGKEKGITRGERGGELRGFLYSLSPIFNNVWGNCVNSK